MFGLLIMVTAGAAFLVLSRVSETVAGLMDRRDERINALDRDATLIAGTASWRPYWSALDFEIASGEDGLPYVALGAIGGVSCLLALVVLRLRR